MTTNFFRFQIESKSSECLGRVGKLITRRGEIPTPVFMPVGTQATVKTLTPKELTEIGARIILANTYHLFLRPGTEVLEHFGGLHKFMGWDGPILTDSGGFQVFSLKTLNEISDEGVWFSSHHDGKKHFLTPEESIRIQQAIGSEIMMVFDECCPYPADEETVKTAMERSVRWAERCRKFHPSMKNGQALFGILQGGVFPELRKESLARTVQLGFEGIAIGGLSVGEPKELMLEILRNLMPRVPEYLPRYLMGVGAPEDLFYGVEQGIDMFDCVLPTRLARHGAVFTNRGRIDLTALPWRLDDRPIEEKCSCFTCKNFSRAYLRHLFKAKEMLAMRLASIHNLCFLFDIMRKIRIALLEKNFINYKKEFLSEFFSGRSEHG